MTTTPAAAEIRYASPSGRWVLLAAVLGSSVAFLDATVVNVALPAIGEDLGAGLDGLQWTVTAYLLTLAAFILVGGSLGDRLGRRRVFVVGVVWFALASALCGLAPGAAELAGARALQGVGAALLTPGSLALIEASFAPGDRGQAIGAWSGLTGIAAAVGPFAGGWLIDAASWRLIFLINLPLAALTVAVAVRHVPESKDPTAAPGLDVGGAVLAIVGLAGCTYALIEAPAAGASPAVVVTALAGLLALGGFVAVEARSSHPMLPLDIFASPRFTSANVVTFVVYAALGGAFFVLVVQLQQVLDYSALEAGAATLPVTVVMLALSSRAGRLAQRVGPRGPMTAGPIVMAVGLAMMTTIDVGSPYWADVFPAVVVFALGLALTVAPLTATVLAAADPRHAGVASGVNNAVARVAGLLAVAALPALAGLGEGDYRQPAEFAQGFRIAVSLAAALSAGGGVLAWLTIRPDHRLSRRLPEEHHCALDGPPLRPAQHCLPDSPRAEERS
ncbi:MAG: MFS transporter [Actinomycetota bacterium]|nr:MFS transporter [Actinomycetota bacterium]